jgi:hypothetical protein
VVAVLDVLHVDLCVVAVFRTDRLPFVGSVCADEHRNRNVQFRHEFVGVELDPRLDHFPSDQLVDTTSVDEAIECRFPHSSGAEVARTVEARMAWLPQHHGVEVLRRTQYDRCSETVTERNERAGRIALAHRGKNQTHVVGHFVYREVERPALLVTPPVLVVAVGAEARSFERTCTQVHVRTVATPAVAVSHNNQRCVGNLSEQAENLEVGVVDRNVEFDFGVGKQISDLVYQEASDSTETSGSEEPLEKSFTNSDLHEVTSAGSTMRFAPR